MFRIVGFGLLLSAGLLLHECHGKDAASELDEYLRDDLASSSFSEYIKAVKTLKSSDDLSKKPELKELVGWISELRPTHDSEFCDGPNLEKLRNVSAVVYASKSKKPRLTELLGDYIDRARSKCLDQLVPQVEDEKEYLHQNYYILHHLDFLYSGMAEKRAKVSKTDFLSYLHGAKIYTSKSWFATRLSQRSNIKDALRDMFCSKHYEDPIPCGLNINAKTGKEDKLTVAQAQSYFEVYLFEPCERFMKDKSIQPILERVNHLAEAIVSKNPLQYIGRDSTSLKWASRATVCKWFISNGANKFAKLLGENPKTKEYVAHDPVSKVNSYLVDNLASDWDWDANIRALETRTGSAGELDGEEVSKLVYLLMKLRPMNEHAKYICGGPNLVNLRTIVETINGYDVKSFTEPLKNRRLNYILSYYAKQAYEKCLKTELEPQFSESLLEIQKEYGPLKELLDPICALSLKSGRRSFYGEKYLELLFGALLLPQEIKPSSPLESEMKDMLRKIDDKSGKDTEERLNKHLLEPCREFLADKPVQDILERVVDLGVAINITDVSVYLWRQHQTLEWAPITVACKWINEKGVGTLAGMV